tara:strand:- start:840 stop:1082 length:243 start_codon:yes stop_codon:yes gene_type:complete
MIEDEIVKDTLKDVPVEDHWTAISQMVTVDSISDEAFIFCIKDFIAKLDRSTNSGKRSRRNESGSSAIKRGFNLFRGKRR